MVRSESKRSPRCILDRAYVVVTGVSTCTKPGSLQLTAAGGGAYQLSSFIAR